MRNSNYPEVGGELAQMTLYLIYKEIILKITHNNPTILGEAYWNSKKLNELNLWFPTTKFNIPKTMREFASNFNQEKFDKMASELLTSKGNIQLDKNVYL